MSLRSRIITYTDGNLLFWVMLAAVVVTSVFYMYAVNKTIVMVAQREAIESKISANRSVVSKLESQYISEINGITFEFAESLGYDEAREIIYMPKKSVSILTRAERIQ